MSLKFRPFLTIGLVIFLVYFLCVNVSAAFAYIAVAAGTVLLFLSFLLKKTFRSFLAYYLIFSLLLSGAVFAVSERISNNKSLKSFYGKQTVVTGTVKDYPEYTGNRYYYYLDTESVGSLPVKTGMKLSSAENLGVLPYDNVSFKANVYEIGSSEKSIKLYYFSRGLFCGAYLDSDSQHIDVVGHSHSLGEKILSLRLFIESRLTGKVRGENGAVCLALLTGDKSLLSDSRCNEFKKIGVSPVFAVSGLHLSVWILGLFKILDFFKVKKRVNSFVCILFTLFFILITGLSPSVCRAAVMTVMILAGNLFYRKPDSLNSLGLALFIICIFNVYSVSDLGLLLSFSATFGIITIMPLADRYIFSLFPDVLAFRILKILLTAVFVSLSATLGALPVTAFYIGYIPLITLISNITVSYVAVFCMIFSGFSVIFSGLPYISDAFAFLSSSFSGFIIKICDFYNSLSTPLLSLTGDYIRIIIVSTVCIFFFTAIIVKNRQMYFKLVSVMTAACILVTSLISVFFNRNHLTVHFVNVGNGIACVATDNVDKFVLISGSDDRYACSELSSVLNDINYKRIKTVILGSEDACYCPLALDLLRQYDYGSLLVPLKNQSLDAVTDSFKTTVSESRNILPWKNCRIEYRVSSSYSLAFMRFFDTTVLILFSSVKNSEIPQEYLKSDYLVIDGYIPESIDVSFYKGVVSCTKSKAAAAVSSYIENNNGKCIRVCDYRVVSFLFSSERTEIKYK